MGSWNHTNKICNHWRLAEIAGNSAIAFRLMYLTRQRAHSVTTIKENEFFLILLG
jgi:hypothetical protein